MSKGEIMLCVFDFALIADLSKRKIMKSCLEIAIFKVSKDNISRVIELSLSVINEINALEEVILSSDIFKKVDDDEELCWHLTWVSREKINFIKGRWSSFPSVKELELLIDEKVYLGHFV